MPPFSACGGEVAGRTQIQAAADGAFRRDAEALDDLLTGDPGPLRYKSPNFEKGWALVVFVCFSAVLRTCEAHARLPGCRSNSAGRLATTRGGPGISDIARRS